MQNELRSALPDDVGIFSEDRLPFPLPQGTRDLRVAGTFLLQKLRAKMMDVRCGMRYVKLISHFTFLISHLRLDLSIVIQFSDQRHSSLSHFQGDTGQSSILRGLMGGYRHHCSRDYIGYAGVQDVDRSYASHLKCNTYHLVGSTLLFLLCYSRFSHTDRDHVCVSKGIMPVPLP